MELKHRDRIVQIKIVYYGPAVGGKTTNLQMLHAAAQERHRGEFISINSAQDRTILFDLLPLKGVGFHGFEIRFQLVAVPGQARYATTRRLVVRGADAVVFVANSAVDRLQENVDSLREMADYLVANSLDPATIPLVYQHNKQDLPHVLTTEELEKALGYRDAPSYPAVAIRGEGVLETLGGILEQTMDNLMARYPSLSLGAGETVESWTWQMLHNVFGKSSIATDTPPTEVAVPRTAGWSGSRCPRRPRRRLGTATVLADANASAAAAFAASPRRLPPPRRPRTYLCPGPDGLADTYVQASMELSVALERTREERDEARRRLEEFEHTLRAIEAEEQGRSPEESLGGALQRIVVRGGCRAATLLASGPEGTFKLVTGIGLTWDPVLRMDDGQEVVRRRFVSLQQPLLLEVEADPDLARAVQPLHPPANGLVVAADPQRPGAARSGDAVLRLDRPLAALDGAHPPAQHGSGARCLVLGQAGSGGGHHGAGDPAQAATDRVGGPLRAGARARGRAEPPGGRGVPEEGRAHPRRCGDPGRGVGPVPGPTEAPCRGTLIARGPCA